MEICVLIKHIQVITRDCWTEIAITLRARWRTLGPRSNDYVYIWCDLIRGEWKRKREEGFLQEWMYINMSGTICIGVCPLLTRERPAITKRAYLSGFSMPGIQARLGNQQKSTFVCKLNSPKIYLVLMDESGNIIVEGTRAFLISLIAYKINIK